MSFLTQGAVAKGLSDYKKAPEMARALISSGWLPQFRVYNGLRLEEFIEVQANTAAREEEESAWARRLPPGQARRKGFYPAGTVSLAPHALKASGCNIISIIRSMSCLSNYTDTVLGYQCLEKFLASGEREKGGFSLEK